ncbi:glutathione peroxidase [Roseomonas sp. HF4]|uniref:glutathione peroxidase n=1 Tax=Roseomonas sp. HF4 TaxID=2562313 RepID=UPI0010C02CED|nr:glutathione peroxidase [Roseomonas sp. HF4]
MAEALRRTVLALPLMASAAAAAEPDAWSFRFPALEGGEHDLAAWRGRVLLVVNTASFCGFTPQYAALQRLHERYRERGLVVFGVPSNDFNQEAASAAQVREFCDAQFGIDFPLAAISRVRGADAHPFFRWAAVRAGGEPRWNFHKYLVARDGQRVRGFATRVAPDNIEMTRAIEAALAAPGA